MTAKQSRAAKFLAQLINRVGEALLSQVLASGGVKAERAAEPAGINITELERDQAEADPALPGFAEQGRGQGINVSFQIGRFAQALARLLLVHVVVAHFDGQTANAF